MKSFCFVLLFGLLFFSNCQKKEEPFPDCIQSEIAAFSNNSCEHGASIKQYVFQGQTVFVFGPGHCGADLSAGVVDKNCKYLGDLGGITGNTRINGEEFSNAKYIRTVWSRQ
jgi:hypothetical protein